MTWLTSLPAAVLVVGWLVFAIAIAIAIAIASRWLVQVIVPAEVSGQPIDTILRDLRAGFFSP